MPTDPNNSTEQATHAAEELRQLKQEFEQRVAERTTELLQINKELRKSEARYRNVVDCQTDFVVRWTPDAVFTFVNDSFCRLLGQTSEQLIGQSLTPLIHPEENAAFQAAIAKLDRDHPHADFENRLLLADGTARWTHWTNQMLFDEDGQFIEYQSVGRDVTELRNAADTIREKEAHLAHMSRLATMGELVAGMAHEVHQPLHAAKTFAEAARRNLEFGTPKHIESAIDCTREISNAISRTAKIIRQLREFTRPRNEVFEHFDLNQVVREATELIAFETRKAQVLLTFDLADDFPTMQGDRMQLQQICINLLINAYEAMTELPVEERKVVVSTQFGPQWLQIAFRDVGSGATDESLNNMFNAFYSTKPQGMGMGLSLCKSIAETHGGNIEGKRNENAGMTFRLELPQNKQLPGKPLLEQNENC